MTDIMPTHDTEATRAAGGLLAGANRWLLYAVGGVSILAGVFAIAMPFVGTLTAALVAGAALVASGLAGLFTAFRRHEGMAPTAYRASRDPGCGPARSA